jgi:chaperonin GroEL (HSP60 family)
LIFSGFPRQNVTCVILRGVSQLFTAEVERSFVDAFSAVKHLLKTEKILLGGGALEMYLHRCLIQRSLQLTGIHYQLLTHHFHSLSSTHSFTHSQTLCSIYFFFDWMFRCR